MSITDSINCACSDTTANKTLAQLVTAIKEAMGFLTPQVPADARTLGTLRTQVQNRLGNAAMGGTFAPGMSDLIDGWINAAQGELYRRPELGYTTGQLPAIMAADGTACTVDAYAVLTLAVAMGKAHFEQPDAKVYFDRVERYLTDYAARIPPSATGIITRALQSAQEQLYRRYDALRTERWFSWPLTINVAKYDFPNNDEATALATPVNSTFSTSTTGGTLAAATYWYRISAINQNGETLASTQTSQATTGSTSTVTVTWGAVTGATGYKVYGRTTGAQLLLATVGAVLTYTDTGALTPAGALPAANTTACTKQLDPLKVTWVGVTINDGWRPLVAGIPPTVHGYEMTGRPERYEFRQCIELWPVPNATAGQLVIKGHFGLESFTADSDRTTIDSELVFLMALANVKAAFNRPDAPNYVAQMETHLRKLVAGLHGTQRYVPGGYMAADGIYTRPVPTVPFA